MHINAKISQNISKPILKPWKISMINRALEDKINLKGTYSYNNHIKSLHSLKNVVLFNIK
jgi:hypothetical protein